MSEQLLINLKGITEKASYSKKFITMYYFKNNFENVFISSIIKYISWLVEYI